VHFAICEDLAHQNALRYCPPKAANAVSGKSGLQRLASVLREVRFTCPNANFLFVERMNDPVPKPKTRKIMLTKINPCLWFDHQAEDAARFYTVIFKNSKIVALSRYPDAGQEVHGKPSGSVMTVAFELDGQSFLALNGGPVFNFNEAVSFQVICATQEEVDYYWERLSEGGDSKAQQCGWLKDKFGLSWQIVPQILPELLSDPDTAKSQRAFQAIMQMKKLDIAELQRAFAG